MKKELSPVVTGAIILIAIVVIGAAGWFLLNHESTPPSPTSAPGASGAAAVGAQSGNQSNPGGAQSSRPAVD